MVPGLLDGHMHVESGMVTVTEFVRAVLPRGTTAMFIDPHEIANVFGLRGVRLMVNEAARQPIHVWTQVPSCVPAAPGLENAGATIEPHDVAEALTWPGIIGLGEMMNFTGVQSGDRKMLSEIALTQDAGKTVGGHYASPDLDRAFHGYVAGGPQDDHEGTRQQDAVERARQGMRPMLRYGSAAHDVASQVGAITRQGLDSRRFMLCTDDSHAHTLADEGHMDRVLRHAMAEGLPTMTAIQMATINTAEHFGLSQHIGMIAPGRWADLLLVTDLRAFEVELVLAKGKVAAEQGKLIISPPEYHYPAWATRSVHLERPSKAQDFVLHNPTNASRPVAHVIGVSENTLPTSHLRLKVDSADGIVTADMQADIAKVALVQRHKGMRGTTLGLVHGFGLSERCAIASTVAHDCHQLLVLGTDDACMATAVNTLRRTGGGQVVVKDGQVIGLVELEIAGLMSREPVEVVARKAQGVLEGIAACGSPLRNANIQLSFLALTVIPQLRLSDRGVIDVEHMKLIPLLEEA
jgi:adenine deaminase